jgi:hypothetical protein
MRNKKKMIGTAITPFLALLWLLTAFPQTAHAQYTDPGSTALLIQIIGGMILGGIFYFGVFRNWLANKFGRGKNATTSTAGNKSE